MFGAPEPTSQASFTFELIPSSGSLAIQSTSSHKRVISFHAWLESWIPTWLESWNNYLAIMVDHNLAKAPEIITYLAIINSTMRQYPFSQQLVITLRGGIYGIEACNTSA